MSREKLIEKIENSKLIASMYEDEITAKERYKKLVEGAFSQFDGLDSPVIISVPGRTEICGNHTDHQGGKVIASAVSLDTICLCEKNKRNEIRLFSEGYGLTVIGLDDLSKKQEEIGTTASLVRGIAAKMQESQEVSGFDAYIMSDVLSGSGLSSSASFEVAVAKMISVLFGGDSKTPVELAEISQFAENEYFGKPCGLMDQMACAVGGLIYIDFSEKNEPKYEKLSLDLKKNGYTLAIIDSRASHADLTEDYADIPKEMALVASFFDKTRLADLDYGRFLRNVGRLRTSIKNDRAVLRAFHFFKEQERVERLRNAVKQEKLSEVFEILNASGKSSLDFLQNIYSIKNAREQSLTLGYALLSETMDEDFAFRVHGGGFAGTMLAAFKKEKAAEITALSEKLYSKGCAIFLNLRNEGAVTVID